MTEDLQKGLREITASEILDKIQKGEPVEYEDVIVKGNLDISKLGLPKENEKFLVCSPIKVIDSQIDGSVFFSNTIFSGYASFQGATFRGDANFDGATFHGYVDFNKATFRRNTNFKGATFNKKADFSSAMFNRDAYFSVATFIEEGCFSRSKFNGDINFGSATFRGYADFLISTFRGYADFNGATFNEVVNFSRAAFSGYASFDSANFVKSFSLNLTKYEKLYIRWRDITVPKYQWRILAKYQWKILENWRKVKQLDYDDATYLMLIENFKNLGLFEDADNIYYIYRTERRRNLPTPYKPIDWIIMALYGYGVKPLRPFVGLLIVLVAFGLLYSYFGIAGNTPLDAFNTSSAILLSGSQLIGTPTYPTPGLLPYWIFTSEKLLGSLFFGLFLISIGRTIIR